MQQYLRQADGKWKLIPLQADKVKSIKKLDYFRLDFQMNETRAFTMAPKWAYL